jgi:hypothetical protein
MSVAFKRGSTTGPSDLNITMRNSTGALIDPYRLTYAVFDRTTGIDVLMGSAVNQPVRLSIGQYYAQVTFPADCNIGDWVIRWTVQEISTDPVYQTVEMFNVVGDSTITSFTGDAGTDYLIHRLRILLRDNDPDRLYRFSPPNSEKYIQGLTQVFGFIWEDEELLEHIYMAIDDFNTYPPVTGIDLSDLNGTMKRWRTAILYRAASLACLGATTLWTLNEFSYSISGVSLDLEKSSKYQAIADMYNNLYNQTTEAAKASIKIIKGLRQFRYGVGITSALGPLSRPGIQSRRNMIEAGSVGTWS